MFQQSLRLSPQTALLVRTIGLIGFILTVFSEKVASKIGYENTISLGISYKMIGLVFSGTTNLFMIAIESIVFVAGVAILIPALIRLNGTKGGNSRSLTISMYSFILLIGASFGSGISLFSNYLLKISAIFLLLMCSLLLSVFRKIS